MNPGEPHSQPPCVITAGVDLPWWPVLAAPPFACGGEITAAGSGKEHSSPAAGVICFLFSGSALAPWLTAAGCGDDGRRSEAGLGAAGCGDGGRSGEGDLGATHTPQASSSLPFWPPLAMGAAFAGGWAGSSASLLENTLKQGVHSSTGGEESA